VIGVITTSLIYIKKQGASKSPADMLGFALEDSCQGIYPLINSQIKSYLLLFINILNYYYVLIRLAKT
jgi:hypothetical protein